MIQNDSVVSIHYTLRDADGNVLDTSGDEAMDYLHGHENIIPGLENALTGLKPGDSKKVVVPPEQGYGDYNDTLTFKLDSKMFEGTVPEPGMVVQMNSTSGETMNATIVGTEGDKVVLDGNHPLAGKTLYFDVKVAEVRAANAEELDHGHPHGADGHHHH